MPSNERLSNTDVSINAPSKIKRVEMIFLEGVLVSWETGVLTIYLTLVRQLMNLLLQIHMERCPN